MPSRVPSQRDRVLVALRQHRQGISQADFLSPTIDGLPPIGRLAARVEDLRDRGYRIDTRRRPGQYAVYKLAGEPASETIPAPEALMSDGQAALLSPTVGAAPPLSPYDVSGAR